MNPWKTLKIQPTDDKKIIKKAYAVLIKQYKPDENPEKFQEIQVAYKTALSMRQWQIDEAETNYLPESLNNDLGESKTESFDLLETPVDEEQLKFDREQQKLIDNLYKKLHEMAFAPLVVKDKLENWEFIEDFYKIDDLTLKQKISKKVFEKVAEYNVFQAKQNKTLLIQAKVLKYFNTVFNWNMYWQEYEEEFPPSYLRVTFYYIDNNIKFSSILENIASPLQRVWSFILDFAIAALLASPFIIFKVDVFVSLYILISLFILIRLWVELTNKSHTSYGKKISRYIIIDIFGNTCSKSHTIIRHMVLNLSLIVVFYMPLFGFQGNTIYSTLYGSIIIINLFTLMSKKVLFHDYISKTYVISQ